MMVWEENRKLTTPPWNGETMTRGMEFGNTRIPGSAKKYSTKPEMYGTPTFGWLDARAEIRRSTLESTFSLCLTSPCHMMYKCIYYRHPADVDRYRPTGQRLGVFEGKGAGSACVRSIRDCRQGRGGGLSLLESLCQEGFSLRPRFAFGDRLRIPPQLDRDASADARPPVRSGHRVSCRARMSWTIGPINKWFAAG